eukprot:TRINITY_DN45092_c0_g1_i1.p1 TRINITY_DN45092_c0_g1~~TRINITY_DN45092_c0_g1_i1.p1  ORF type:complete len:502 (+),score=148.69 TRINITY_DN45092_c0_g1_i1:69-1574(+)
MCIRDSFMSEGLSLIVLGASGDLAKKKTYPSLFELYTHQLLPPHVTICGFARSPKSVDQFRASISPGLAAGTPALQALKESFLDRCFYTQGAYGDVESFGALASELRGWEEAQGVTHVVNRLYYFAIPPNVFLENAAAIKAVGESERGWTRVIVEKPFGSDLESAQQLVDSMMSIFPEEQIYRIDHYLGKEVVQSLMMLRFGNVFLEPLLNRNYVQSVTITFKEDFGTDGRGGYFDSYGIVRDIMQNHLMQVLTLVAMEAPVSVTGSGHSATHIRDAKVALLKAMSPVELSDMVLGQYTTDGTRPGYLQDSTVPAGSRTATYAMARLRINNTRWAGVPFIMKAGKALDARKAEIRIQFKQAPGLDWMFKGQEFAHNELVLRIQPDEAVYLKCSTKAPGLRTEPVTSELDLSYKSRYKGAYAPDAYTRLILEALRPRSQGMFVRSDELLEAWRIWTPVLHRIEREKPEPLLYEYGSRGPVEGDVFAAKAGYVRDDAYVWNKL